VVLLKFLAILAVLWHLFAFAAGGVYAFVFCRARFRGGYDRQWSRVMRSVDWHLRVSGLLVLGLEARLVGLTGFSHGGLVPHPRADPRHRVPPAGSFAPMPAIRRDDRPPES
jgi:hypothetical protein